MFHTYRHGQRSSRPWNLQPEAEKLESRLVMYSTLGGAWAYGSRITYSFAPDGTNVGGTPSAWYQAMNNRGISQAVWQDQFRKAAATWSAIARINLVEVPDDGTPFSAPGNQQSDARFGDIRIAGIPQSPGILATAFYPPRFNGGTLAGDIVMNTNSPWAVNGDYDILTVAIHEIGHSLGMGHSAVAQAVQYASYTGRKQTLHSDDIAGLQSVYGAREPDVFEPNNAAGAATSLASFLDGKGQVNIAGLDISTANDQDWFVVVAPPTTTGKLVVKMQSSQLSSLSPRVTVFNAAMQTLGNDAQVGAYGATATVTINGVSPGQVFYVRATPANTGPTGAGAYGLQLNFGNSVQNPLPPPGTVVPEQPNQGGGSIAITVSGKRYTLDQLIEAYLRGNVPPGQVRKVERQLGIEDFAEFVEEHYSMLGVLGAYGHRLRADPLVVTPHRDAQPIVEMTDAMLGEAGLRGFSIDVPLAGVVAPTVTDGRDPAARTTNLFDLAEELVDAALGDLDGEGPDYA